MRAIYMEGGSVAPTFGSGTIAGWQSGAGPSAHSKAAAVPIPVRARPRKFRQSNSGPSCPSKTAALCHYVAPMETYPYRPASRFAFPVHRSRPPSCPPSRPPSCPPMALRRRKALRRWKALRRSMHLSPAGQTGQSQSNVAPVKLVGTRVKVPSVELGCSRRNTTSTAPPRGGVGS